ncbi:MAG: ABC transporter ATP-binding protein [Candidatus Cryptobacteroides sp.]
MIQLINLLVGYKKPVAGPLDFEIADGKCVMLFGPNGSGKSTLLKTLAGILPPLGGRFTAGGEVVLIPTHIPKVKGFTVREFIRTGLLARSNLFAKLDAEAETRVERAVETLDLAPLAEADLTQISDGEFQKACLATALTRKADVILLDEPTAFLDVDNRVMVLKTLQQIARSTGTSVLFSTHDIYDGEKYSDSSLKLSLKH